MIVRQSAARRGWLSMLLLGILTGCSGSAVSEEGNATGSGTGGTAQTAAARQHSLAEIRGSQNKLKQIGAALLGKFDGTCPAGFADRKRKPLLSWRVAILPHLGYEELFKRFNLLEPWDSPANRKLLAEMPEVYRPMKGDAKEGHTFYQGFVGADAMFPPESNSGMPVDPHEPIRYHTRPFGHILDGSSYTLLVVEGGEAVPWTRPDELIYDPKKPLPALGGQFEGDFNACFCDGSVHLIPRTAPEKLVRALITPAGQERVDLREIGLPDPIKGAPGDAGKAPPRSEALVKGKITYKGEPLGGGDVTFRSIEGKEYAVAITPEGTYLLAKLPAGEYKIAIDTEAVKNTPRGGKYVRIPRKYGRAEFSGIVCEVKGDETQTIDFVLNE